MNAINQNFTSRQRDAVQSPLQTGSLNKLARLSEALWLSFTFLLFIAMGPFSTIAVVYGLWSLGSRDNRKKMIEPASC